MQKKSNNCETSSHYDDNKRLAKSLNDQINFLKSEIKSKNAISIMILNDQKKRSWATKTISNRRENNTGNTNGNHKYQFQTAQQSSNLEKADTNKDFSSPNRFAIFQDYIKEHDHDLNEQDPVDGNYDSNKDKKKQCRTKTADQNLLHHLL